jgi:hypothetical protein
LPSSTRVRSSKVTLRSDGQGAPGSGIARVDRACLAHLAPALPALGHPAAPRLDAREAGGSRGGEERGYGLVVRDLLDTVVTENALIRTKGG